MENHRNKPMTAMTASPHKTARQNAAEYPALDMASAVVQQRMAIAEQLHTARKKAGLTQVELANRMKVSQPLIARLECGRDNVSCDTLARFAIACGCLLSITIGGGKPC